MHPPPLLSLSRSRSLAPLHLLHPISPPYLPHISPISPRRDLASFQLASFPDMADAPIRTHYAAHPWSEVVDAVDEQD